MTAPVIYSELGADLSAWPPKGAAVAIVVFQDLQCPKCRTDAPLEEQAAKAHNIPLVRRDFPLPMHNWSFNAAVQARYFERGEEAWRDGLVLREQFEPRQSQPALVGAGWGVPVRRRRGQRTCSARRGSTARRPPSAPWSG